LEKSNSQLSQNKDSCSFPFENNKLRQIKFQIKVKARFLLIPTAIQELLVLSRKSGEKIGMHPRALREKNPSA
jgi:hypothetical protein